MFICHNYHMFELILLVLVRGIPLVKLNVVVVFVLKLAILVSTEKSLSDNNVSLQYFARTE